MIRLRCILWLIVPLAILCLVADTASAWGGKGKGRPGVSGGGGSGGGGSGGGGSGGGDSGGGGSSGGGSGGGDSGGGSSGGSSAPKEAPTASGGSSVDGADGSLKERDPDAALKESIDDQMKEARARGAVSLLARVRDRELARARSEDNQEAGNGGKLPANLPPPEPAPETPPGDDPEKAPEEAPGKAPESSPPDGEPRPDTVPPEKPSDGTPPEADRP